ncbi:hypothetical protein C8R45DRAFT_1216683 [Mycena sanguinolenta]|nr:hypothetical protein C8R45DRAFT_1216683 [Mycena sanguinolenta]
MSSPDVHNVNDALRSSNWENLQAMDIWRAYERELQHRGYHFMDSTEYDTLGEGDPNIPPAAVDPFHPTYGESFVHHFEPEDLLSTRNFSLWQPIGRLLRSVVMKAIPHGSPESTVLRKFSSPPLRAGKRNRVIPVIDFIDTKHDFIIPRWGICWNSPPCGNMTTRGELAIKLTETLQLFHEHGVAHGDFNIVINHDDSRNFSESCHNDFRQSRNIEYAYIDFGAAHIFAPGTPTTGCPNTRPPDGFCSPEQETVMEDDVKIPIDLFAADVYNIGKTVESELLDAFEEYGDGHIRQPMEYEQYKRILRQMTDIDPSRRPAATGLLELFYALFRK